MSFVADPGNESKQTSGTPVARRLKNPRSRYVDTFNTGGGQTGQLASSSFDLLPQSSSGQVNILQPEFGNGDVLSEEITASSGLE